MSAETLKLVGLGVVALVAGFSGGRVNLKAKLAAVETELKKVEGLAVAEVQKLIADIRKVL